MLPQINHIDKKTAITDVFYGYNHRLKIGDGESYDEQNLCSDLFPVMSPVRGNGDSIIQFDPDAFHVMGVYALDDRIGVLIDGYREIGSPKLLNVYSTDGSPVASYNVSDYVTDNSSWNVLTMGAYIVFYPIGAGTGFTINTVTLTTRKIGREVFYASHINVYAATVDYQVCTLISSAPPSSPNDGDLYINSTSGLLYRYSAASNTWTWIADTYATMGFLLNAADLFRDGDSIHVVGMEGDFEWLNGDFTILKAGEPYATPGGTYQTVVLNVSAQKVGDAVGDMRLSTPLPNLDFVFSHENRLWGCRYDGVTNSIYASKLGDPGNWYSYQGIATDSYEVTIGDAGKWTGAVSFNGNPVFFKKDRIYTIYGSYPAEYTLRSVVADGVDEGSIGSIAYVGGYLYYYSPAGFMRYSSYPQYIGENFEGQSLNISNGIGANHKYYAVSGSKVYAYDTLKGIWHIETHQGIDYAIEVGDKVFLGGQELWVFHGGDYGEWFYESGDMGIHNPTTVSHYTSGVKANNRHQYVTKLTVRAKLSVGAQMHLWFSYDEGEWEHQATIISPQMDVYEIPLKPKRCHSFRLKISGHGECRIYAITKDIEEGSV